MKTFRFKKLTLFAVWLSKYFYGTLEGYDFDFTCASMRRLQTKRVHEAASCSWLKLRFMANSVEIRTLWLRVFDKKRKINTPFANINYPHPQSACEIRSSVVIRGNNNANVCMIQWDFGVLHSKVVIKNCVQSWSANLQDFWPELDSIEETNFDDLCGLEKLLFHFDGHFNRADSVHW